ncbi:MAG TPA: hypothetical protein VIB47_02255 [Dehalococcoidia bacterium]
MLLVYGLGAWLVFMVSAIVNGAFRVSVLQMSLSEHLAHLISTAILCVVLFIEINVFLGLVGDYSDASLLALGVMWTLLTVAFEFGFGHYVAGDSWGTLLENYDVRKGRVWPAVLVVVLITPVLVG